MRKLYGSTSWRRILALALVFVMMLSVMGTSGYSVFAEDLAETGEEVVVSEPEAVVPEVTEDIQGPSPGEEAEEVTEPVLEAEEGEELEEAAEAVEEAEEGEELEEAAEAAEETEEGEETEEPAEAAEEAEEAVEETEEAAEEAEEGEEAEEPEEEPAEEEESSDPTLIEEAAQIIEEDDGEPAPEEEAEEPAAEAEEVPGSVVDEMLKGMDVEQPAEEELVEEEVAMPAARFYDIIGGVSVTVEAPEGAFPAGTQMMLAEVEIESIMEAVEAAVEGEIVKVKAVDITFLYEGEEIQPELPISVKMNASGMSADSDRQVLHIDDEGEATVLEDADTSKKAVEFEADSFSVYVVVATGEDARLTIKFVDYTGEEIETMMINKRQAATKVEEYIFDPSAGEMPEGTIFKGWTTVEQYTDETPFKTIEDIREDITNMTDDDWKAVVDAEEANATVITYHAMVFDQYIVTFNDERGILVKTDVILVRVGETPEDYEVTQTYTPYPADQEGVTSEFMGWQQLEPEVSGEMVLYMPGNSFTLAERQYVLKAYTEQGHWLGFDENLTSASYTEPQFVAINQKPTLPATPTRAGYTFDGWYTEDADPDARDGLVAGDPFDFNAVLTANATVYAKWIEATTADYNVIIWLQNLAGNGYDYSGTTVKVESATVGNNTYNIVAQGGNGNGRYARIYTSASNYTDYSSSNNDFLKGFHLGSFDSPKAVASEGNTVINVYFDRNEHTFTFRANNTTIHTVTKLYGQDISGIWSFTGSNGVTYPQINPATSWQPSGSSTYTARITRMEIMPDEDITFTHTTTNNTTRYFHYYVEALPGATGTRTYNNVAYSLYTDLTHDFNRIYYNDDFWNLDGFTRVAIATANNTNVTSNIQNAGANGAGWQQGWNSNLYFYYSRNAYDIYYNDGIFVNGSGYPVPAVKRENFTEQTGVKYQADISEYDITPTLDRFVFLGWYDNEACEGDEYDFTTMPSHHISLYAKWGLSEYGVTLHANDSTDDPISYTSATQATQFWADNGEQIGNVGGARIYSDLVGWYLDPEFKHPIDFGTFVLNNTMVGKYGKLYTASEIDPQYPTTIGEVNLYAKWRSKLIGAAGIKIEYDAVEGKGTNAPTDENYYVDLAEALAMPASIAVDADYVFSHWKVQKWDGSDFVDSDVNVYPGDNFDVLAANARITDATTGDVVAKSDLVSTGSYVYTIQLKADYIEKSKEVKTFINWYNNYDGGVVAKSENIKINEATPIPDAPSRDGYTFLGWIRGIESEEGLTALTDLWITYTDGKYYQGEKEVTLVAADENLVNANDPNDVTSATNDSYHALYAKWEAQISVEVTGSTASVGYNGSEQSNSDYTVTYIIGGEETDTLPEGITCAITAVQDETSLTTIAATGTEVGTYTATVTATLTGEADGYAIITASDSDDVVLTINPVALTITITGTKVEETYDGTEKTAEGYTAESDSDLFDEDKIIFTGDASVSGTEADTYPMGLAEDQFSYSDTTNFTKVTFEVEDGELKINPIDELVITITGDKKEFTYDGETHMAAGFVAESDNELFDEGNIVFSGKASVSETDAGTYPMGLEEDQFSYSDTTNFTKVTFNVTDGELKINPIDELVITITGTKVEETYDGTEKTAEGYEASSTNELFDEDLIVFTGEASVSGTEADTYPMGLEEEQFSYSDTTNFTKVTFEVEDGELKINPIDELVITIIGNKATYTYDGTEKTAEGYEASSTNELFDEDLIVFTGEASVSGTYVAVYPMGLAEEQFSYSDTTNFTKVTFNVTDGELKITDGEDPGEDPVDDDLVVTKAASEDKTYALGDTVTFNITATNIYNEIRSITLSEIEGVTLEESTFADVAAGGTIKTTATYTITEVDVLAGSFTNTVTAKVDRITKEASATVNTAKPNGHLTVEKVTTSEPAEGEAYKLGEEISYKITVTNDGNLTITDITVSDELTKDTWTIASLAPGATQTYETAYTVTEADVLAGEVLNVATAKGTSPDPKEPEVPVTPGEDPEPTEEPNGHLTVTKETTSETPREGYALGDEITYKITVTNDGNLTITDITVEDELTGNVGEKAWSIASLAPGASEEFTASYTVTEADILKGEVVNVATAAGTSPDPDKPDVPVDPGEDPEPTEGLDTTLSVKKEVTNTPADEKAFKLGEEITYTITVKNEGNATYKNVKVVDEATGLNETITELRVGERKEFNTSHVVTEEDILNGSFSNTATAKADPIDDPKDPENPKTPEGEDTVTTGDEGNPDDQDDPPVPPIEGLDTTLSVTKEITNAPADGKAFKAGETIEYKITVKNEGNVPYYNVVVKDELVGLNETIEVLPTGEKGVVEYTRSYTVTEDDIVAGEVTNTATAAGDPIDDPKEPNDPKTPKGEDTITTGTEDNPPIADKESSMTVNKVITSKPADGKAYVLGEEITYEITVTNTGNVTIRNITVTDELTGDEWTIESLAPGKTSEAFTASYTVNEKDTEAGKVVNTATAAGSGPQGNDPEVTPGTVPAETKQTVIYYTNYPTDMENEYSEVFDVTPGYKTADFLSVFEVAPKGYKFNGWKDQKSGKTYSVGDLLKALAANATSSASSSSEGTTADGVDIIDETPDADFVLYAQWAKIKNEKDPKPPVEEPDEPIEEPDVPLAPIEEEPDEPVEEPDSPFAPAEEEPEEIGEEPMPFSPYTGDDRHTAVWGLVSLLSLAGIVVVARKRREE